MYTGGGQNQEVIKTRGFQVLKVIEIGKWISLCACFRWPPGSIKWVGVEGPAAMQRWAECRYIPSFMPSEVPNVSKNCLPTKSQRLWIGMWQIPSGKALNMADKSDWHQYPRGYQWVLIRMDTGFGQDFAYLVFKANVSEYSKRIWTEDITPNLDHRIIFLQTKENTLQPMIPKMGKGRDACLAQLVEHTTLDLWDMNSSPTLGVELTYLLKQIIENWN